MVNCQAVILLHELTKRGINVPVLEEYCNDRKASIVKYGLKNKEGIYELMFSETSFNSHPDILEFHKRLYKTFFPIIYQENVDIFKTLLPLIKAKKIYIRIVTNIILSS